MANKSKFKESPLGLIPKDWDVILFGQVADKEIKWSITGGPFGSNLKASDYTSKGVRIIQLQNIGDGYFRDDYKIFTSEKKADELKSCNIYPGEIIISKMGDPVARACFIPNFEPRFLMASDGIRFVCDNKNFDSKFVLEYINFSIFRKNAIEASTGTTRARIGLDDLKNIPFPKIPLKEQIKIAKILSTWDSAIESLEQLIVKKEGTRKVLMQQLLTGKKRFKEFKNQPWLTKELSEIAEIKGGKRLPKGESLVEENTGFPYIRVTDMFMGGVNPEKILFIPKNIEPIIKNYKITTDDLFITVAGTIGLVGVIPEQLNGANLTENANKITNLKCDKIFLMYVLLWNNTQQFISSITTNNAQPKLAIERIRKIPVPCPSTAEQTKIGSMLQLANDEISSLKSQLNHYKNQKQGLMQHLLTGKLRVKI